MANIIRFANHAQAILYECELKGQMSDGYWENSRPHDHWKIMCDAEVTHAFHADLDSDVIGKNFKPMRKYNFNDKSLVDCVGERMIGFVKFYTAFPDAYYDDHWDFEFEGSAQRITENVIKSLNKVTGYYREKAERIMKTLGVKTIDELTEAMQKVDRVEYTMKMLRKDLKHMSEIVNA